MRLTTRLPLTVAHATPAAQHAHVRIHQHDILLAVTVKAPYAAEQLRQQVEATLHRYGYPSETIVLNDIVGIEPTFEGFAAVLRESLLAVHPTVQVAISDHDYAVSTE